MKTYYIVRHENKYGVVSWEAYRRGILSALNFFFEYSGVDETHTTKGPDDCEELLRKEVVDSRVVRMIKIP